MIEIDTGPFLFQAGSFLISWHGFFSFIGVASAIFLVGRWGRLYNINPDDVYSIAMWGILSGIIGARLVHVIDNTDYYLSNPTQIVAIWSGGIGLWGGIIGGFVGGITYALITKKPAMLLADITAPAFLFAQSIGRLGDIVNGEHCARATGQFFGFIWTNSSSAAINCANGIGASVHPVIAYEILWNMIGLLIIWKLRNRLTPPGMIMFSYFAIYSAGRFVIQFFREDPIWALGLQEAQFIAIIMLTLSIIALALKAKLGNAKQIKQDLESIVPQNSRAEKRRQLK